MQVVCHRKVHRKVLRDAICNGLMVAMHVYAVPLYDSLGESSVEYIIGHSEASIVFTSTQKFPLLEKTLHKTKEFIKTIVYFGDVTDDSKRTSQAAEKEVNLQTMHASCTKSEKVACFCVRYSSHYSSHSCNTRRCMAYVSIQAVCCSVVVLVDRNLSLATHVSCYL